MIYLSIFNFLIGVFVMQLAAMAKNYNREAFVHLPLQLAGLLLLFAGLIETIEIYSTLENKMDFSFFKAVLSTLL